MTTMVQVAKLARVSISTVSHVLNGTRNVDPETRQRVLDAIEQTGYRQDALARSLRRARTDTIGLVVSDAGEPAFAEMVHGVEQAAAERGLTLVLANSAEDADREERAVQTLLNRRVDGLILARAAASKPGLMRMLEGQKPPTVLLDRIFPDLPFDQVGAENRWSMSTLVDHMAARGFRKFLYLGGDLRVPTLQERLDGFIDGVRNAGLDSDQIVLTGSDEDLRSRLGDEATWRDTSAVIAGSTPLAVLGLRAAGARGLTVPDRIGFATFDGFDHADLFKPRLTTVRQPAFDMGVAAVSLLVERVASPELSPRTVRLRLSLEPGDSTPAKDAA